MAATAPQKISGAMAEEGLELEIEHVAIALGRAIKILMIDDESVYRNSIAAFVPTDSKISSHVQLLQALNSDEAIRLASTIDFDLIISDVDLGPESLDGFELTRALRTSLGVRSLICIHSNRICAFDQNEGPDAGTNSLLPKPMGREQFLRLILNSAVRTQRTKANSIFEQNRDHLSSAARPTKETQPG